MPTANDVLTAPDQSLASDPGLLAHGVCTFRREFPNGEVRIDRLHLHTFQSGHGEEWLWPGHIPLGRVTLLEGDEGKGKSFVALDLAARVSRPRRNWPDGAPMGESPEKILVVARPDEVDSHCRRLTAMDADLSQFHWWRDFEMHDPQRQETGARPIAFPCDLPALDEALRETEALLVVIDSLADVCPRPQDVAETLRLLNQLARTRGIAILVTLPVRARFDAQGGLRVTSRWKTEEARCVWCVAADPDDPRRRLFIPRRFNFCEEPSGIEFRLAEGRVAWNIGLPVDPHDPLDQWKTLERCLNRILQEGSTPARDVFRQGSQCGFNPRQMRSGARRLGIESHKSAGFGDDGCWLWFTPEQRQKLIEEKPAADSVVGPSPAAEGSPASAGTPVQEERQPDASTVPAPYDSVREGQAPPLSAADAKNAESLGISERSVGLPLGPPRAETDPSKPQAQPELPFWKRPRKKRR